MSLRLHTAPWVVPIARPPLRDGAVLVDDEQRIVAVASAVELRGRGGIVEHTGVLTPGFVNAHTHLELSHLAGRVRGGDGLAGWIGRLLAVREQEGAQDPETVAHAAKAAIDGMCARGTVAVGDVTNGGACVGWLAAAPLSARSFGERLCPRGDPAPAPPGTEPTAHATYTCSAAALRRIADENQGQLASIHVEEDPAEAAFLGDGTGPLAELLTARGMRPSDPPSGRRPVQYLDALGVIGRGTLLVHLTFADDAALAVAAHRGAVAVLCPRSNQHITGALPNVARVRAAGLAVAIGTDSLASTPSLDPLGEVAALARAGGDPEWLLMAATRGGAHALGFPHLGELAPGRRPGLVELGDRAATLTDPIAWVAHEALDAPVQRWG